MEHIGQGFKLMQMSKLSSSMQNQLKGEGQSCPTFATGYVIYQKYIVISKAMVMDNLGNDSCTLMQRVLTKYKEDANFRFWDFIENTSNLNQHIEDNMHRGNTKKLSYSGTLVDRPVCCSRHMFTKTFIDRLFQLFRKYRMTLLQAQQLWIASFKEFNGVQLFADVFDKFIAGRYKDGGPCSFKRAMKQDKINFYKYTLP